MTCPASSLDCEDSCSAAPNTWLAAEPFAFSSRARIEKEGLGDALAARGRDNVQISVKASKRFASTGGWGYGQFENGVANQSEPACY